MVDESLTFVATDVEQTWHLASHLAALCTGKEVLALSGPLGAGKTYFVKGLALGLGIPPEEIRSPTFALLRCHVGRVRLYHLDAYRLADARQLVDIGIDDFMAEDGITVIEWAEKVRQALPAQLLQVQLSYHHDDQRLISLSGTGPYASLIRQLRSSL